MLRVSYIASFLLPLLCLGDSWKTQEGAHSLCLDFTVKSQHRPGQPWCKVQGSVDEKLFLQHDSDSNKAKHLGDLGEKVNATRAWRELTQMLREVEQELRIILSVIQLEENKTRGPTTLQAKMCCERHAERCAGASWQFSFNGQTALLFDTMNKNWTLNDSSARKIKRDWENNKELAEYLRKIAMGDCNYWLSKFLEHWEEMLEPSVSSSRSTDSHKSSATQLIAQVIPTIIIGSVLIVSMS